MIAWMWHCWAHRMRPAWSQEREGERFEFWRCRCGAGFALLVSSECLRFHRCTAEEVAEAEALIAVGNGSRLVRATCRMVYGEAA